MASEMTLETLRATMRSRLVGHVVDLRGTVEDLRGALEVERRRVDELMAALAAKTRWRWPGVTVLWARFWHGSES